jgi:glycosyltransferase involved in cell wall biosynthesis
MVSSIDVIIPCFNGEAYLRRCIESILTQTQPVDRIIVVNDGSTDNSKGVLSSLQAQIANLEVLNKQNGGLSSARNSGLHVATAAYIAFLDVDDYWLPDKLRNQLAFFKANGSLVGVASEYFTTTDGINLAAGKSPNQRISARSLLMRQSFIPGSASSLMIRNTPNTFSLRFDESLDFAEDLDYSISLAAIGEIGVVKSPDVVIVVSKDSMQGKSMRTPALVANSHFKILRKNKNLVNSSTNFFLQVDIVWQIIAASLKTRSGSVVLVLVEQLFSLNPGGCARLIFLLACVLPIGTLRWSYRKIWNCSFAKN